MMRNRVNAWLALFRVPNLFTAPGDPLAGALLAGAAVGTAVAPLPTALGAAASLCLYAGGLVANDALGAAEDARERPERPIPSGHISRITALVVALFLTGLGLGLAAAASRAALWVAVLLSVCVWAYNVRARSMPFARPIVMGACRGLSLLLGSATIGPAALLLPPPLIAAAGMTLFVAVFTAIAGREVGPDEGSQLSPWLLVAAPAVTLAMMGAVNFFAWIDSTPVRAAPPKGFPLLLAAMAVVWVSIWCGLLFGRPDPAAVRTSIASLVRGLLLVQAALCSAAGGCGEVVALGLLAAFVVASWVGRWIKGS